MGLGSFPAKQQATPSKFIQRYFLQNILTSCQCIVGTEKYPDRALLPNYDDDDYSQGHGQTKEDFRALTKDDILQPGTSEDEFGSSNDGNDFGYNIHSFDIRYQKNFETDQPIKAEFLFSATSPLGYMVVL